MRDSAADDVSEHRFKGLLIAIIILNRHEARTLALLLTLAVGLLAHDTDGLVGRLDSNGLDITDRDTIDHCSLFLLRLLSLHRHLLDSDLFGGKVARAAGVGEALIHALSLAHGLMRRYDVLGGELLSGFIRDPLKLTILHFTRDGRLSVGRHSLLLILDQLLLDWLNRVINSVTAK